MITNGKGKQIIYNTFKEAENKYKLPEKLISRISRGERKNQIYQGLKIEILKIDFASKCCHAELDSASVKHERNCTQY